MVSKKQKYRMMEYLGEKLSEGSHKIEPVEKIIINDITSRYLIVDDIDLVLLVDQEYPNNSLDKLLHEATKYHNDIGIVFYKDGKTFFREGASKNYFKKNKGLSLKHYNNKDIHKIINFKSEEKLIKKYRGALQYYQPESPRLKEELVTYKFKPLHYDYSHVPKDRFRPISQPSNKLFLWYEKHERDCPLILFRNYLRDKKVKDLSQHK